MTTDPNDRPSDEALEWCAREIEEAGLSDIRGIMAKRKRVREDADLRFNSRVELRRELAGHLRALKGGRKGDAVRTLREIAGAVDDGKRAHDIYLHSAWPLAWKGWLDIESCVKCNSNSLPPEVRYVISITEKGREIIASSAHTTE